MTLLFENYDGEFFKQLPHLRDASVRFSKQKVRDYINRLEPVFVQHGMTQKYGLIMVHRHFDMEINEILVETVKGDHSVSVAIPWEVKEGKAFPATGETKSLESHGIQLDKFPYIVPQTWSFSDDGNLKAYEFLASKDPVEEPNSEFVRDLFQELKGLGLEQILGLRLIDNLINRTSWETTPHGGRANVLAFGPLPEGSDPNRMSQVVFMFNKDGQGYCCCEGDDHSWMQCYTDWC